MEVGVSLTLLPALGTLFLLLGCPNPALTLGFVPSLIVTCYTMFDWYLLEGCSFLKGNGGGVDGGREVLSTMGLQAPATQA